MRYYIIAGEASGDLHAANLMKELKKKDAKAVFRYWGGDLMQQQGGELVKHYKDLAFMGFVEVIANLKTIFNNIKFCKKDVMEWKPDVLILVDYPGFNLRIAAFAKAKNIKIFYYISPQVWAWKQSRVYNIKKTVDRMFVILPFEKPFYEKFNYEVDFAGHPLLDAVEQYALKKSEPVIKTEKPVIALLPGSRKQEINMMLPIMLKMQKYYSDYLFVIAGAPSQNEKLYQQHISNYSSSGAKALQVQLVFNKTYQLLQQAQAALVTSGTATLETALFGVPEVVCYKGSTLSYIIAKRLVKVNYISLVNLIMDKEIVKELIQNELTELNLRKELNKLFIPEERKKILSDYEQLKQRLGGAGASEKTAALMISYLQK